MPTEVVTFEIDERVWVDHYECWGTVGDVDGGFYYVQVDCGNSGWWVASWLSKAEPEGITESQWVELDLLMREGL